MGEFTQLLDPSSPCLAGDRGRDPRALCAAASLWGRMTLFKMSPEIFLSFELTVAKIAVISFQFMGCSDVTPQIGSVTVGFVTYNTFKP